MALAVPLPTPPREGSPGKILSRITIIALLYPNRLIMEFVDYPRTKEIWFDVPAQTEDLLDRLAFIHLLEMKFDGIEIDASCFRKGKTKLLLIKERFPTFEKFFDARAHCKRNLDSEGVVVDAYKGALDAADPGRKMAEALKERAELQLA